MPRSRLQHRLASTRTVLRTAAAANGPRRFRLRAESATPAVIDTTTPLPPLDLSRAPWPGEQVRVGGADLFVRHTPTTADGDVPTAVYVHGLGGASTNWTDLAAQLQGRVEGFAPDLPGFGRSGPSGSSWAFTPAVPASAAGTSPGTGAFGATGPSGFRDPYAGPAASGMPGVHGALAGQDGCSRSTTPTVHMPVPLPPVPRSHMRARPCGGWT